MFDALLSPGFGQAWRITTLWPRDSQALMRRSLIRILAIAHLERLDTPTLVANLAGEHRGRNRRRLRRLARRLQQGTPLVEALEQTPEVLSDSQVLAIRFGSQSGTLAATYQGLIDEIREPLSTATRDLRQTAIYVGFMGVVLIWLLSFLLMFIFPVWRKIYEEFNIGDFPFAVRLVFNLQPWVGPGTMLGTLLLIVLFPAFWASPLGRWARRTLATSRLRWVWQRRIGQLFEMLALVTEAGRPMSSALSTLARYHFDRPIRNRLLFARNELEQGAGPWESLHAAGLLTQREYESLAASQSRETEVWLLRSLARQKRERTTVAAETAARGLQTLTTLAIAAVVALVSLAAYQSLVQLITNLL